MRIGVVAPSTPIMRETAARVTALAAAEFPEAEILFDPQCFVRHNHFAGTDDDRAAAFLRVANDPAYDALWFARGGYGSCRIAEDIIAELDAAARHKAYLGYSDAGFLLAGLYRAGFAQVAHGPMPNDIIRDGGDAAVRRALDWLVRGARDGLEPSLVEGKAHAAFNLTVLSQLLGTALEPDLAGHVLMIEDIAEYLYRTDRALFHVTGNRAMRRVAGLRLGRCSDVPVNDPDFGGSAEDVVKYWCERAEIPFLGDADIGHDADNRIVPFGRLAFS